MHLQVVRPSQNDFGLSRELLVCIFIRVLSLFLGLSDQLYPLFFCLELRKSLETKVIFGSPTSFKICFPIFQKTLLIVLTAATHVSLFLTWLITASNVVFTSSGYRWWLYCAELRSWKGGYQLNESGITF